MGAKKNIQIKKIKKKKQSRWMIPEGAAARQTNFERRETSLTMVFMPL
jgi:hypothetical protein